jgi:hypothetical protein
MQAGTHYTYVILDQDADGNRAYTIRTSATPEIDADADAVVALGPVAVGTGESYADDIAAVAALAEASGVDLDDPNTWDELFEETLEDEGTVII